MAKLKDILDVLKRWGYKTFISKYYVESVIEAQNRGYRYGVNDVEEKYHSFAKESWHVEPYDVLKVNQLGQVFLGGEPITENEMNELKAEVAALKGFRLWDVFQETIREKAIDTAVLKSHNYEETLSGKLMIHNLGIMKSIVETIDKYGDKSAKKWSWRELFMV